MPNFNLNQQPQYPIVTKDTDMALTNDQIISLFSDRDSITLCVRSSSGHPNRGGYYFCIHKISNHLFQLETMEGVYVDSFDLDILVNFINHASGRKFNSELLNFCQNNINFRPD